LIKGKELLQLIRSLDDREELLYRRHLGQNLRQGRSHNLILLNVLETMATFDESVLIEKLGSNETSKHLATHITRMFDHLVEFLQKIERFPSIDAQLSLACERVLMLYQRGLLASARKELKKAQKLAAKHENFLQLLRLADLERTYFFTEVSKKIEPHQEAKNFRDAEFLNGLQRQVKLKMLHFEASLHAKMGIPNPKISDAQLSKLSGKSIYRTVSDAQATPSDLILLDLIGIVSRHEGDFDRANLAYSRMDALWVSSPDIISENAHLYISSISGFLNACLVNRRYVEFKNLLENLKTVHFTNDSDALRMKDSLLYLELIYCLNRCQFEKGIALGPEIEELIRVQRGRIVEGRVITFFFNLCSLHFMLGQYRKANRMLVQILNLPRQDYRKDVLQMAPSFQLVLFAAMEDRELLAARLRALVRMRDAETSSNLEGIIIQFATDYLRSAPGEVQNVIERFHIALKELMNATAVSKAGMAESLCWAEGKLKGKLPGEVFKEYVLVD
jgi:tetratricopeptide (TPR) repeat protein